MHEANVIVSVLYRQIFPTAFTMFNQLANAPENAFFKKYTDEMEQTTGDHNNIKKPACLREKSCKCTEL